MQKEMNFISSPYLIALNCAGLHAPLVFNLVFQRVAAVATVLSLSHS